MLYHFYQLSDYTSYFSNERTRIKTLLLLYYGAILCFALCQGRNLATKKVLAQAPPYTMPLYTSSAPVFFRTSEMQIGLILTITRIPEVSKP